MSLIVGKEMLKWTASYAWTKERGGPGLTVRRFRREIELVHVPDEFLVHVSADSRYILWVNGQPVGRGPLKGTLSQYRYECYDLAPHLNAGTNVIAAEVRWFGDNAPYCEVHGGRAGFLCQGPEGAGVDTPGEWKVQIDHAIQPDTTAYISNAAVFLNHMELVDARRIPLGWKEVGFDDSDWEGPVDGRASRYPGPYGEYILPHLVPRDLPMLTEEPRRFTRTIADRNEIEHLFGDGPKGWVVARGATAEIILDAGCLTTGYPVIAFSGGAGRRVEITYAECVRTQDENGRWVKGVRDDIANGDVPGYRDTVTLPGGEFTYEPFHWRTFWFIKIAVFASDDPLTVKDASYKFTTYPQELRATYESSDPASTKMLEVSFHTLQLCSHETYEDCPYYEQLQYIGDTRLEALCSLALAGETRFPRHAIDAFMRSARPDGLVHAREPSSMPLIIPYFALLWVLMVDDYWQWVGPRDRDFVQSNLHAVDGVLWFFRNRLRDDGFVGHVPHWNMVDRGEGWSRGEPPAVLAGESTYLTCLFIHAMNAAVRLHTQAGDPRDAERWRALADELRPAVRDRAWSDEQGLFLEGPARTEDKMSQHSQIMAILSGAASPEQIERIKEKLTNDTSLIHTALMQGYYLGRTLEKIGMYAEFPSQVLPPYRAMLDAHLSSWCEYWPGRSDSHAWSSWIAVDFLTAVLGIKPAKPGFEEILIRPQTQSYDFARGSMPTIAGEVSVSWEKDPKTGAISLEATAPDGVPTMVEIPGLEPQRHESGGKISLSND